MHSQDEIDVSSSSFGKSNTFSLDSFSSISKQTQSDFVPMTQSHLNLRTEKTVFQTGEMKGVPRLSTAMLHQERQFNLYHAHRFTVTYHLVCNLGWGFVGQVYSQSYSVEHDGH